MRNMDPPVKSKMAARGIYHGMGNEEPTKKREKNWAKYPNGAGGHNKKK